MLTVPGLFALMVACEQEPVVVAPPPEPPPLPEYDMTLDEVAEIDAWKAKTLYLASVLANPPDPKILDGWKAAFRVTDASVKTYLAEPHAPGHWNSDSFRLDYYDRLMSAPEPVTPFAPSASRASELETSQEHFEAGYHYAALGDKEGIARCMKALERKLEWNAIAILAYKAGDNDKLFAAMDKMRELSWNERMKSIVSRAIEDHQTARAEAIAKHYSWNLWGGEWDAQLEKAGDPKVAAKLVERRITRWIELAQQSCRADMELQACEGQLYSMRAISCDNWRENVPDLVGIVKLANVDRGVATKIARQYLESRYANVVAIADECGEGGNDSMVAGTLEFYTLVRSESDLKLKYLAKTRGWATGSIGPYKNPQTGEEVYDLKQDVYTTLPSHQFYAAVKALGDQDLIQAWSDNLALIARVERYNRGEEENTLALDRYLLGLPGSTTKAVNGFAYGEISQQELTRIWGEIKLPTPPAGSTFTLEQIEQTMAVAEDLDSRATTRKL